MSVGGVSAPFVLPVPHVPVGLTIVGFRRSRSDERGNGDRSPCEASSDRQSETSAIIAHVKDQADAIDAGVLGAALTD
jgi:hypothetical protein